MAAESKSSIIRVFSLAASLLGLSCIPLQLSGQAPAAAGPDELVFVNGEKLAGHLQASTGTSLTFNSDMVGVLIVDWSKVKELHSSQKFAVIPKGVTLKRNGDTSQVPQGTVSATAQTIQVATAAPAPVAIPVSNTVQILDQPSFTKAVTERPGIFHGWGGSATFGMTLVRATQNNDAYTSAVALTRTVPSESWMDPSNRTILTFNSAYGKLSQPGTPSVKTSLWYGGIERDEYFSPRVYVFLEATFDHDYAQGLDLQQTYGGGVGWTVVKTANSEFDVKGGLNYVNQRFLVAGHNRSFLGSVFSQAFTHTFPTKLAFHEEAGIQPAWTDMSAYSAFGTASLSMPVYKSFSATLGALDTFLNDPPPGFRKNSFTFTAGLTYTLPK